MNVDLRELQRALAKLGYTTPLAETAPEYVPRPDDLGQKILGRIMEPGAHRLLLGGPAGCGKSTEILRIHRLAQAEHTVVICPCDRDLDLYKLDLITLVRYLTWRILFVATAMTAAQKLTLTPEIVRDALACVGSPTVALTNPRMFFAGLGSKTANVDAAQLFDTFSRLVSEIERAHTPVLLLVDGLEKVPPHLREQTLGEFVRSPLLDHCQTVIVVPLWTLYGRDSMESYSDVEVLRIGFVDDDALFVQEIIEKRAGAAFDSLALSQIAAFSGGLPRDGLQLAFRACREALDERSSDKVKQQHVIRALDFIQQSFEAILSDDPERARAFLRSVQQTHRLPGDPALRDLMLGHGMVLPAADGTVLVHPAMADFINRNTPLSSPAPAA